MHRIFTVAVVSACLGGCLHIEPVDEADWDNWRGPGCRGLATGGNPPIRWSEQENLLFKIELPGEGGSSPIVWGDRIYVTSGIKTAKTGTPPVVPDPDARRFSEPAPTHVHDYVVLAIDRHTGLVLWRKTLCSIVPHEGLHNTMTQVSASPVTDGEFLYLHFGSRGLYCLDMDGRPVWSKQLGIMRTRRAYGEASSPALHGDTLVVNWDHEGDSFVVALDKRTGEERWRRDHEEVTSWSTPLILTVAGRPQVIIAATGASRGYDLETGKVIWSCGGMTVNCIPTPVYADGLVYLMSGYRGRMLQAVRLEGASGDITDSPQVVWQHREATSYVPSGLLMGSELYFLRGNTAVLSCLDAKTGKVHYGGQRLRGLRTIYSSPIGVADRFYITDRGGITKVIGTGTKYQELASNKLEDTFDASAAIVGDRIYLRGRRYLYAIAQDLAQ
ncbi:MAG: PQQ-binding-like beta-propeller repeat protein [Planctomycetota bacterium]|nr:PQQ-binding-like beta-propeller repeat protein [Planctomycetota bacterium]